MTKTKLELNIVFNYIDEVLILDREDGEDKMNKLEYVRNYFVVYGYDRNLPILNMINEIIDLYYMKNEENLKIMYEGLQDLIMDWARYEKTIS